MTQQLQQIIDTAWENRASISPAAAPKEVADAVAWLCSDGAAAVHGQCLSISGGEVM